MRIFTPFLPFPVTRHIIPWKLRSCSASFQDRRCPFPFSSAPSFAFSPHPFGMPLLHCPSPSFTLAQSSPRTNTPYDPLGDRYQTYLSGERLVDAVRPPSVSLKAFLFRYHSVFILSASHNVISLSPFERRRGEKEKDDASDSPPLVHALPLLPPTYLPC